MKGMSARLTWNVVRFEDGVLAEHQSTPTADELVRILRLVHVRIRMCLIIVNYCSASIGVKYSKASKFG